VYNSRRSSVRSPSEKDVLPQNSLARITETCRRILGELPEGISVLAAAKSRSVEEVQSAIQGGIRRIGHNYLQEAEAMAGKVRDISLHMIGHLQRKKVPKAVDLFQRVETLDSLDLAQSLQKRCEWVDVRLEVLVEVNIAREQAKTGIVPEDLEEFLAALRIFDRLQVRGLMTMGPTSSDPEKIRPFFRATRQTFDRLRSSGSAHLDMTCLSMGMSDSYRVAIEEGATQIRLGTALFGPRYGPR